MIEMFERKVKPMESTVAKHRFPKWAVNLLIWCCPTLALLLAYACIPSIILDRDTIASFVPILLTGLIVTRLIFLFRSHRTIGAKIWRAVIWMILLIVQLFLFTFFPLKLYRTTKQNAQNQFEATVANVLPDALSSPLKLESPESIVLHKYLFINPIYTQKADTLLCKYNASDYEVAKTALENQYSFRTEPLNNGCVDDPENMLIDPYIRIGDDTFRFLSPKDGYDSGWEFYKRSLLVVTNDTEHEIGYILFNDFELDWAENLTEFIIEECGWKYIR